MVLYNLGVLKDSLGVTKLSSSLLRIVELERMQAITREKRDTLKKPLNIRETDEIKYVMIDKLNIKHSVQMLCSRLNASVIGYLVRRHKPASPHKQKDLR